MKMLAPAIAHRSSRSFVATLALASSLWSTGASALIVPMPPREVASADCPAAALPQAIAGATILSSADSAWSGSTSKLAAMSAQQAGLPINEPELQFAMPSPSAGVADIGIPSCVDAVAQGNLAPAMFAAVSATGDDAGNPPMAAMAALHRPVLAPSLLPVRPLLAPVDVSKPDVFGSVALSVGATPLDDKWQRVQATALGTRSGPGRRLIGQARDMEQATKIEFINRWVNQRTRFVDDNVRFRVADSWATVGETLRTRQGDCEDYAIAKMKLLEAAGIARGDMFLVIAKDLVRRADHALLVVRRNDRLVVLDNNTDLIIDAAAIQDYRPIISYSAGKAWIHGYESEPVAPVRPNVRLAALGGTPSAAFAE
jgi:predicted transglutaminase-like cysteine proteinase